MVSQQLTWVLGDLSPRESAIQAELDRLLGRAGWQTTLAAERRAPEGVCLVWAPQGLSDSRQDAVAAGAARRNPTILLGRSLTADLATLREASGVVARSWVEPHPARLQPQGAEPWIRRVCPVEPSVEFTTSVLTIDKVRDDVEVWLSAPVGLSHHPVLTWSPETSVGTFTALPELGDAIDISAYARILHLALRRALGIDEAVATPRRRVGLLGFGAIGAEHAKAIHALPGLELTMVCDRNPERVLAATEHAPNVRATTEPSELLDSDVDLIVVSTPPDSHADWAERALHAGNDVVIEKPLAISLDDADRVIAAAADTGRHAVVYQNRRYDPDFLSIRGAVEAGKVGDLFHLETFIGGYGHPCNYWHSDADVSGGAVYDWGSHILDQVLALHPSPIRHVTAIEHKRRWLDVTNADHTSMTIRFEDGAEASFVHSDLAAALKPRWYLLGSEGALTSRWRREAVISRTEIGTLAEDRLLVTDAPPDVLLIDSLGAETQLVPPEVPQFGFHRELVDELLYGWPMSVTVEQSRRVVAVMDAARASAHSRGEPVRVDGEM